MYVMRKLSILGILATAMLLGSCTNDDAPTHESEILKGINVTIEQADFFSESRSTYQVDPARGFVSSWSAGDVIGIYPLGGDQVSFPISEGEGSATARFDGGSWALRSNMKYSAYYPFKKSNYIVSETEIPVSYIDQAQNGNNSTAGLAAYDYLAAAATQPNSNGSVDLTMKHLGAFVRFQLTMPKAATLVNANVASDDKEFVTAGTIDLSAATPAITSTATSSNFDVVLSNITCAKDEVVTLYAMVAPLSLSGSKMTITLKDNEDKTYIYECDGVNFAASKSYNFTITETSGGTGATIEDAGWAENQINGHEYVDLGLSVKWATCNVGANSPEEYGDYFAWGETTTKSSYSESNSFTYEKFASSLQSSSIIDSENNLTKNYDAATKSWGATWRMPTLSEIKELVNSDNCTWLWTTQKGVNGYKVTSKKNGNSIFLPAAGGREGRNLDYASSRVYCWSATTDSGCTGAYNLGCYDTGKCDWGYFSRDYGQPVRPVSE